MIVFAAAEDVPLKFTVSGAGPVVVDGVKSARTPLPMGGFTRPSRRAVFLPPAASGCGPLGLANGPINDELGLPAAGGKNTARLEGLVNPPIGKGVRADFTPSTTAGPAPLTVNFNGTSSTAAKTITSYAWDFGNGQTASGSTAFTTYATPGTYDAKLTITDSDGDSDTTTVPITVEEPVSYTHLTLPTILLV